MSLSGRRCQDACYNDLQCTSPTWVECRIVTAESTGGSIPTDNKVKTLKNIKVRLQSTGLICLLKLALSCRLAGIHRWRKLLEAGVWCPLGERKVKGKHCSRSICLSQGLLCSGCQCDLFFCMFYAHVHWSVHAWANFFIARSLRMGKVEYEKPAADLHTELFAKIPFPLAGNTLSDRMASSVMQILGLYHLLVLGNLCNWMLPIDLEHGLNARTGSELGELNAQRLLEILGDFQRAQVTQNPGFVSVVVSDRLAIFNRAALIRGNESMVERVVDGVIPSRMNSLAVGRCVFQGWLLPMYQMYTYFYTLLIDIYWNHVSSMYIHHACPTFEPMHHPISSHLCGGFQSPVLKGVDGSSIHSRSRLPFSIPRYYFGDVCNVTCLLSGSKWSRRDQGWSVVRTQAWIQKTCTLQ